jgi:hypothetical protein
LTVCVHRHRLAADRDDAGNEAQMLCRALERRWTPPRNFTKSPGGLTAKRGGLNSSCAALYTKKNSRKRAKKQEKHDTFKKIARKGDF